MVTTRYSDQQGYKSRQNIARSPLLVGPREKKTDRDQRSAFPSETSRFAPCTLVSRRGFSRPIPRRPTHLPFPERIWCLLTSSFPPSRFTRRYCTVLYARFGTMNIGKNGLTCGFNWQCTANDIGYAVSLVTARLNSNPYRPLAPAGRQPGQGRAGQTSRAIIVELCMLGRFGWVHTYTPKQGQEQTHELLSIIKFLEVI